MINEDIINFIQNYYPCTTTKKVAEELGISESKVRSIANKHNIQKSEQYLVQLKNNLVEKRRIWYENNIPLFQPTEYQEQLIYGSLLGDGFISKGAKRSKNYYYQEHFGEKQREYREWKLSYLNNLGFSINGNYLRSISHPYFTNLSHRLYPNGEKILTSEFLSNCIHPLFLATLYMDDGSLVISYRYNKSKNIVYCYPSIILYTLCFSLDENKLLANHLNTTFGTSFVVSGHPDGKGFLLKINKEKEVRNLLNVISSVTKNIHNMAYKTSLERNISLKTSQIKEKYGAEVVIKLSSSERYKDYSEKEIKIMIEQKKSGSTDQQIATRLGRSYWSVVYKISDLRKRGLL